MPTLFVLATIVGIGGNIANTPWIKITSTSALAVFGVWAAFLKWGKEFLNKIGGNIEATNKEEQQSLSDIRQELTTLLAKRKSSLIVVMDDLDRLTTDQLMMVFQLIKANLEFPNVVFLLLFQRDIVEKKLTDGNFSGRDYLEKIIQVPFDIPKVEKARLHHLLFAKLNHILGQYDSATKMFDSGRWGNIFHDALHVYFDTLRNVYRFTSTLSFHFSLLDGKSAFEVNPVDLIAIECLRVFEPDVHKEIARSKEIFTKNGQDRYEAHSEVVKSLINEIIDKAHQKNKKSVNDLISHLFPTIEWAMSGSHYSGQSGAVWLREMRVCHPSNFDKYFQFSMPTEELSNSDLQKMLLLTSDAEGLSAFILSLKGREISKNALCQFEAYSDEVPLENGDTYIKALLDVGDKVDHERIGFTFSSSHLHLLRLVISFIKRYEDIQERGNLLMRCFNSSSGLSIIDRILCADQSKRDKSEGNILLNDEDFESLKREFVHRLVCMAEENPEMLMTHSHLVPLLFRWKLWGNEEKVTEWLKSQAENVDGCINLLTSFVRKSSSQEAGSYTVKIAKYIELDSIENFLEIDPIKEKINDIDESGLDFEAKEVLQIFREALDRREKGISDDW